VSSAGNAWLWLRQTLKVSGGYKAFERLTPDGHGLVVAPFWAGERSPAWRSNSRASILGMNLHTSAADIALATLEAICYSLASIVDRLSDAGFHADKIVLSGGMTARNNFLATLLANVLGRSVHRSVVSEASARGASILALADVGLIAGLDSIELLSSKEFRPDDDAKRIYIDAKNRWLECNKSLRDAGF